MSERMKQEGLLQGVAPALLRQHQNRGREALRLEMAGDYAAARAWQQAATRVSHPQWRLFALESTRQCWGKDYYPQAEKLRCQPVFLCSDPERRTVSGTLDAPMLQAMM